MRLAYTEITTRVNCTSPTTQQLGAGHSESTPEETALPTFTPQREAVNAKRVVETGSPEA